MRFLFNADGCGVRKTSGTDGIATCWGWESSRSWVSRRRPPSSDELLSPSTPPVAEPPQTLDVVLTRNGSARAACVLFPKKYALCWQCRMLCSIYCSQNYAGIIYASLPAVQLLSQRRFKNYHLVVIAGALIGYRRQETGDQVCPCEWSSCGQY